MAKHHPLGDIEYLRENLLKSYKLGFPILKELIQNAEDAKSTCFDYGWIEGIKHAEHPLLKSPALFILDNGEFTKKNAKAIQYILGGSSKPDENESIGKFGLGLKSVFHLCEAFFYVASKKNYQDYPGYSIFNPWAGENNKDSYHSDWSELSLDDRNKLQESIQKILTLEEYIQEGKSDWLLIWIPLRQKFHKTQGDMEDGIELGFIKEGSSDFFDNSPPVFLNSQETQYQAALLLPLLSHIKKIRFWNQDLENVEFEVTCTSEARRTSSIGTLTPNKLHQISGEINVRNFHYHQKIHFSGIECLFEDHILNQIVNIEYFPKKFKSIKPHISIIFTWSDLGKNQNESGTLTLRTAVFLPTGEDAIFTTISHLDYCLTLHGYFFVDFARTGVLGWDKNKLYIEDGLIQSSTNSHESIKAQINSDDSLKNKWNQRLYELMLGEFLCALKEAYPLNADNTSMTSLCRTLKKYVLDKDNIAQRVFDRYYWVYRLTTDSCHWELVSSHQRILAIPNIPNWEIWRELDSLPNNICLVLNSAPNLISSDKPDKWRDDEVVRILESLNIIQIFDEPGEVDFWVDWLETIAAQNKGRNFSVSIQNCLQKQLKEVLTEVDSQKLGRERQTSLTSTICKLDQSRWFCLDCHNVDLLRHLNQVLENILLIPRQLNPFHEEQTLSKGNAVLLISSLMEYSGDKEFITSIIKQIVRAVAEQELPDFRIQIQAIRFIPGYNCRSGKENFYSLGEIRDSNYFAFKDLSSRRDLAKALQKTLAEKDVILVDRELAQRLCNHLRECDNSACFQVLQQCPNLSASENRTDLLERLLR